MLATLRSLLLLGLPLTYAATNIIDASDPSISFSPGWTQEFSQATEDSFLQTDGFGCSLAATLPSGASSVSYVAFARAGGSTYGYALDCEEDCVLQTVNGSDPSVTDDASVDSSTIFSIDLDPSTQHTLRVYNIPSDQPDGSSQITFNNLAVDVQDNDGDVPGPFPLPSLSPLPDPSQTATDSSSSSSSPPTFIVSPTSLPVTPSPTSSSGSVGVASSTRSSTTTAVRPTSSGPTSIHPASSGDTRSGTGSSTSTSTATNPLLPHITSSSPTGSAASSSSSATKGPSKSVIIGVTVLVVVLAAVIVAGLVVFLRQRRQRRGRDSFQSSSQPPLSPTGSIIPIMPPPEMRTASLNPFSDPYPESSLDGSSNSSLMQRRMESRSVSPGAPPNIPLPDLPLDRGNRMEGRPNSPATPFARNDLWITRSPARAQFSVV